jgi:hypothetical protein
MQRKRIQKTATFFHGIRGLVPFFVLLSLSPSLWARGRQGIDTRIAEGREVWQTNFDLTNSEPGKYNVLVRTRDAAGNETSSGPFNIQVDPNAGLPVARVVFPEADSIIRQDINLIGVASGRFGVARVMVRLDDGDPQPATGTDYWNRIIDIKNLNEGRHLIRVQANDSKGMTGPEFAVSFVIDRASPAIELVSHRTGDVISGNLVISGRADDANGIGSVAWSGDGGESFTPLPLRTRKGETAAEFSFALKTGALEDGPVIYYIRAADKTGALVVKPYLFFVDNHGPELQILSPRAEDEVYDFVRVTGRIYDRVGLDRFYYEWGGTRADIPLRPGDPFWTVDLPFTAGLKNAGAFKVTAVDRSGNVSAVSLRLQDQRKVKTPVLVIDYPAPELLAAMPPDAAIYGHIAPGVDPDAIVIEGMAEEITARSGFRISPDLIPPGRSALKIYPRSLNAGTGTPLQLRINKPAPVPDASGIVAEANLTPSRISVSAPAAGAYVRGSSFTLEGRASSSSRLEYRLHPTEGWRPLSLDENGSFRAEISIAQVEEGPVHLELRTYTGGAGDLPFYHPLNRASSPADLQIFSPALELGTVHGNVTVSGMVSSAVPLADISYSRDNTAFTPLPYQSRHGRAWFSLITDFTALNREGGALTIRVTDVSGAVYTRSPVIRFDAAADTPALIVNSPHDGDVITGSFEISGVAFDDDGVAGVFWRILKPLNNGEEGEVKYDTNVPFQEISTSQSFQLAIPFNQVVDGSNRIELYAGDIYGTRGEILTRTIKVSTAAPETAVTSPTITDYTRQSITIRGVSSDANGIEDVRISMDNGTTYQLARGTKEWSLNLNTAAYVDGVYSLLIRTSDKYGIEAISNALINIDNTPPSLSLGTPANGDRVGTVLSVAGRVQDNIELQDLQLRLISVSDAESRISLDLRPEMIIMQSLDVSALPQGEYILRVSSSDRAGNASLVARKILITRDETASEVALFNPMPGMEYSGPLFISGKVTGADIPKNITLFVNHNSSALVEVDRYGFFRYQYPDERLVRNESLVFSAGFDSPSGRKITSKDHPIEYVTLGPILTVSSHQDGDVITNRPWLSGQAWISVSPLEEVNMTRQDQQRIAVKEVLVSFDNGRSFGRATGKESWKYRLETGDLPPGPLSILIKAEFNDGRTAVRRLILTVDTNAPRVETFEPVEDSTHRDNILVYGAASDDYELDAVEVSLRPGDKAGYSVPGFIQGLYLDTNILGATWIDVGLGLSFFKDNVKLQTQVGLAPDIDPLTGQTGRFIGTVWGMKLLANIFYLPFDFFLGPDWSFFSMSLALGANFSYFTMNPNSGRDPLIMGAVLGQWEFVRADLSQFFPRWRVFKTLSLYVEPIFWFASSDVNAEPIFRCTFGARVNIF